jgi:hypothetical protein
LINAEGAPGLLVTTSSSDAVRAALSTTSQGNESAGAIEAVGAGVAVSADAVEGAAAAGFRAEHASAATSGNAIVARNQKGVGVIWLL